MQDLNDKATGGTLSAAEWNEVPSEIQNVVVSNGQVLTSADLNQLGKAIATYATAGSFFVDTGVADAYIVNALGSKQGPPTLDADADGLLVRFRPTNNNTGASTLDLNGIGAKDITREDGGPLISGDLVTTTDAYLRWNQSADDFMLQTFVIPGALDVPRGYIDGYTLSNDTDTANDIAFGVGVARDQANSDTMSTSSAIVKQIDVTGGWVAGTNQAGLPDILDPVAVDTWVHCFIIKNPTSGLVDAGYDTSVTAVNLLAEATGYTLYRRVGSVLTNGSSDIVQFTQIDNEFFWNDSLNDVNISNQGTGEVTHTITSTPLGVAVMANISITFGRPNTAAATAYRVGLADETLDPAVVDTDQMARTRGDGRWATWASYFLTNTVRAIKTRQSASDASAQLTIQTSGWRDFRGKSI